MYRFLVLLCIGLSVWVGSDLLHAQQLTIRFLGKNDLRKADLLYKEQRYEEAIPFYRKHLSKKKAVPSADVLLPLAYSLHQTRRYKESENLYRQALAIDPSFPDLSLLDYYQVLLANEKIKDAQQVAERYLALHPEDETAMHRYAATQGYASFFRDSLQYEMDTFPGNTTFDEYAPTALTPQQLIFCSNRPSDGIVQHVQAKNNSPLSHLYLADRQGITPFDPFRHPSRHDGPVCFWNNATEAVYSANENGLFGTSSLSLWHVRYQSKEKKWSDPVRLPFQEPGISYSHPSFDAASQSLYFTSDHPDGYGGTDLYRATYRNGEWLPPENLGNLVNTAGDETFPFLFDQCLYFASDGHAGMGGLDVYVFTKENGKPQLINLGYPINTAFDDFSLILNEDSVSGWFASNRSGNDDLYRLNIYRTTLSVAVQDALNFRPVEHCTVKLLDDESGEVRQMTNTGPDGKATCTIIPGKHYTLKTYQNGYASSIRSFIQPERDRKQDALTVSLSRLHQRYVRLALQHKHAPVPDCRVYLMDLSSDSILTYTSDSTGSLLCPINADTTVVFYFRKDSLQGQLFFEKDTESLSSSGMVYHTVELSSKVPLQKIKGKVFREDGTPVGQQELHWQNQSSAHAYVFSTDETGAFEGDVHPFGKYCITAEGQPSCLGIVYPALSPQVLLLWPD